MAKVGPIIGIIQLINLSTDQKYLNMNKWYCNIYIYDRNGEENINTLCTEEDVAEMTEYMLCICEALDLTPSTTWSLE